MGIDLDNYVTVAERITTFYNRFPGGVLNRLNPTTGQLEPMQFVSFAGADWVIYTAYAYRNDEDKNPGVGTAWERIPGTTSYTKGSEIQNAETSAWGRAIIAIGAADSLHGIASREEVQLAQFRQEPIPERDWVAEAQALTTSASILAKWQEAAKRYGPAKSRTTEQLAVLAQIASLGTAAKKLEEEDAAQIADLKARAKAAVESGFVHDEAPVEQADQA